MVKYFALSIKFCLYHSAQSPTFGERDLYKALVYVIRLTAHRRRGSFHSRQNDGLRCLRSKVFIRLPSPEVAVFASEQTGNASGSLLWYAAVSIAPPAPMLQTWLISTTAPKNQSGINPSMPQTATPVADMLARRILTMVAASVLSFAPAVTSDPNKPDLHFPPSNWNHSSATGGPGAMLIDGNR
jgi:hypothetical protein